MVISARSPGRSRPMWTAILTGRLAGSPSSHSTASRRSLSRTFLTTVRQSRACTVSPRPRVMNPTIPSPGTGEQHLPKRTRTSSTPRMRTAPSVFLAAFWARGSSRLSASRTAVGASLPSTCWTEVLP